MCSKKPYLYGWLNIENSLIIVIIYQRCPRLLGFGFGHSQILGFCGFGFEVFGGYFALGKMEFRRTILQMIEQKLDQLFCPRL